MFEKGQIVYHNQVIFGDNEKDSKKCRPCVVLFSLEYEGNCYVCTCPFTSQVKAFNKNPNIYEFIPEQIYQYRKLSFAKLDSIRLYNEKETHSTGDRLDDTIVDSIISAFFRMRKSNSRIDQIKYFLQYEKLFSMLEDKENTKVKKLEKAKKRRDAKRFG